MENLTQAWREDALEIFKKIGMPSRKLEAWRYTKLPEDFASLTGREGVEINFLECPGVKIKELKDLSPEEENIYLKNNFSFDLNPKEHPLAYLNQAYLNSDDLNAGYLIEVQDGCVIKENLEILIQPGVSKVFIKLGKNSELNILEKSENTAYSNHLTFCELGEGAKLNYLKNFENKNNNICEVSGLHVRQLKNSFFNPYVFGINLNNNFKHRFDLAINLMGSGATCDISGAYYLKAKNHFDWHTSVNHQASDTRSNILAKGILDESATGVFYARAHADKDLKNIEAHQKNQNILLSNLASIYTQPVLNIHTSGISCTHGATVGELDPAALFYLESRGIAKDQAREILISAFLSSVILEIKNPAWQDLLKNNLSGE